MNYVVWDRPLDVTRDCCSRKRLSERLPLDVCRREVTATLPVRERGNTVQRRVTHVHSEYGGCFHASGCKRSSR